MPADHSAIEPRSFTTFGALLRYLRRRAHLTQRDLGLAVGYSEGHINRFEKDKHRPEAAAVAALFIPALSLEHEPDLAMRLVDLAQPQRLNHPAGPTINPSPLLPLESIPPPPPYEIERPAPFSRVSARLTAERRVLLSGMAGVGKTALAAALARTRSAAMPVFWLTLTDGVTTFVDLLVHQLALFLATHGQDSVKPLLDHTANPPPASLDRHLTLIAAALNRQPALLCFDNAEVVAGNTAFLQVLRHLCLTTTAEMLLTSRESLPLAGVAEITLSGLERPEGLGLIARLADGRLDAGQALRLFEKTGGNPMLIRLAAAHLVDSRADPAQIVERLDAQPQMATYLLETVEKQSSPAEWLWLSFLAVCRQPVNLEDDHLVELLQSLGAGLPGAPIAALQRRHLIDDATRAELHPLVRDYVYRALGADSVQRRRLHRLAADWYADRRDEGLTAAHHYAAAGLLDETVEVLARDEKGIIARGQVLEAVAVLDAVYAQRSQRRALPDDVRRRWLVTRGGLLSATLRAAEAEADFRQALALSMNPAVRADLVCRMRMVLAQRGQYGEALQLIQAARAGLAPTDQLLQTRLFVAESSIQELLGHTDEAQRCAEQAIAFANQVALISMTSAEEIRAQAYYDLANVARRRRHVDVAIEYAHAALSSARQAQLRLREIACLAFIGGMLYDAGDLEGARRYCRNALAGAQAIEDQVGVGYYLTHLADMDYLQLRVAEAREKLNQAIPVLDGTGEIRGLASALNRRAIIALQQGNMAQARATILRVLNDLEGEATRRSQGYYLNTLARIQLIEGDASAAQITLQRALALPAAAGNPMLTFELNTGLALARAVGGDGEAARCTAEASPRIEGLSLWAELDRDLVDGCVAIARGEMEAAARIATRIAQASRAYPLYHQAAARLERAAQQAVSAKELPRLLWVGID